MCTCPSPCTGPVTGLWLIERFREWRGQALSLDADHFLLAGADETHPVIIHVEALEPNTRPSIETSFKGHHGEPVLIRERTYGKIALVPRLSSPPTSSAGFDVALVTARLTTIGRRLTSLSQHAARPFDPTSSSR